MDNIAHVLKQTDIELFPNIFNAGTEKAGDTVMLTPKQASLVGHTDADAPDQKDNGSENVGGEKHGDTDESAGLTDGSLPPVPANPSDISAEPRDFEHVITMDDLNDVTPFTDVVDPMAVLVGLKVMLTHAEAVKCGFTEEKTV